MGSEPAKVLRLLERSYYEYSLGHQDVAKRLCLKAVSSLNTLLKNDDAKCPIQVIRDLSQFSIEFYQKLKSNEKLNIEEKIIWFGSALNGQFFPPLVYGKLCDVEYNCELDDKLKLSPNQEEFLDSWVSVKDQDWSFDGLDDIYQDYLQDCSFVVALISLSRNNKELLLSKVTPQSNIAKRFGVRLHFSGCERLVEIGNSLPLLKSKSLFIKSKSNPNLFWPALLEKAYLKVLGNGYDSKGSNASIDTYLINGWIPEFISSTVERPNFNSLWEEIYENFQNNKLVLAIGTGDDAGVGYHPNHDYSIIDLIEDSRSVVVKNPWNSEKTVVEFHEIFDNFETLYINWNMKGYNHLKKTFLYKGLDNQFDLYLNFPQFHLRNTSNRESEFFLLLEKHLGFEVSNINIAIYETNGERVLTKSKPLVKCLGNNTGFNFTRFKLRGLSSVTIVIFNDSAFSQNFTLHVFNKSDDLTLTKAQLKLPFIKEIEDKWEVSSCGGNWSNQSYIKNPQYELTIPDYHEDVSLKIGLFTRKDVLINFQLFWDSKNDKPFDQAKASLINEKYTVGTKVHELKLVPNLKYKLVLSTYDTDILEDFKLIINSPIENLIINKLNTRLGLFSKSFKFNWNNKNRFKLKFAVTRETNINVHLRTNQTSFGSYRPKIRASLFYENQEPIQLNPDFDDNLYGIWLQNILVIPKATIILLVERFEIGNDDILGEIGSDFKVELV